MSERGQGKKDRMSEESVMRSLNTDAGRMRYIAEKGETKKTRSRRRGKRRMRQKEFNELDGKGFLNSEGISNRAIPTDDSFPAARDPAISNFSRVEARIERSLRKPRYTSRSELFGEGEVRSVESGFTKRFIGIGHLNIIRSPVDVEIATRRSLPSPLTSSAISSTRGGKKEGSTT